MSYNFNSCLLVGYAVSTVKQLPIFHSRVLPPPSGTKDGCISLFQTVTIRKEHILPTQFTLCQQCYSSIHSIGMCRIRFLAVLRNFFHSSLLCTFSCHPSPPTILPSSLTPSCHLFLGPSLNLVVPKFIYNTLLGILFSSINCTCPNQHNPFNLIVSITVGFLTLA